MIIPIAIFTSNDAGNVPDTVAMAIPSHEILRFHFLKVELGKQNWRQFIDSDNPVAAALLAKMGYNKREAREVRFEYLRMILRLQKKLDRARLALLMSVADIYFEPNRDEDEKLLQKLSKEFPFEGGTLMELMPAWKRWGYEEGLEEGQVKERQNIIRKMLEKGLRPEEVARMLELPVDEIRRLTAPN